MYQHYVDGEFVGIKVEEIHRGNDDGPEGYGAADMPYRASRFRPLVKDKISQLRKLLTPKPDEPDEPAKKTPVKRRRRSEFPDWEGMVRPSLLFASTVQSKLEQCADVSRTAVGVLMNVSHLFAIPPRLARGYQTKV